MSVDEVSIFSLHLKNASQIGARWFGFVDSKEKLHDFENNLSTINVFFQTISSHYRYLSRPKVNNEDFTEDGYSSRYKQNGKLMFSTSHGAVPVSLTVPFRVISQVDKGCILGKERPCWKKPSENGSSWSENLLKKKKRNHQGTKKKGCTATMHIKQIEMYPEYEIDIPVDCSKTKLEKLKKNALERLHKDMLSKNVNINSCSRFYIAIDSKKAHTNHEFLTPDGVNSGRDALSEVVRNDHESQHEEDHLPSGTTEQLPLLCTSKADLEKVLKDICEISEKCTFISYYCIDVERATKAKQLLEKGYNILLQGTTSNSGVPLHGGSPVESCSGQEKRNRNSMKSNASKPTEADTQVSKKARITQNDNWQTIGRVGIKVDCNLPS